MADKPVGPRWLVSFRLPEDDLALLDALVAHMNAMGDRVVEHSRTDILRIAIRRLADQELNRIEIRSSQRAEDQPKPHLDSGIG
jgi:hypothetical protein